MKANTNPLQPRCYYHIYNRGINGCPVFKKQRHYNFFLSKYLHHVSMFVDTFAYCLLNNHFHFLISIKSEHEILKNAVIKYPGKDISSISKFISSQFAHLFNGYTQSFNKEMNRTGGLFESPFRRIEVTNDHYFSQLIAYIHLNPEKHRLVADFRDYPHSSYHSHLSKSATQIQRTQVLTWFGGVDGYKEFHQNQRAVSTGASRFIVELD